MHTAMGGTPACPEADRPRRLAVQLADMIPGAATIRVSLTEPSSVWPHPRTVARDEGGNRLDLSRTTSSTAARWVMRVWPEADWTCPHTFDLVTATLTCCDPVAAHRGR